MTLSFNFVLGLFLLAPGLAIFARLYHGGRLGRVASPPPPPSSILALSIVAIGALGAHMVGAGVFWLQDVFCRRAACLAIDYPANVYAALFDIAAGKGRITGLEVLAVLSDLTILTALSFLIVRPAVTLVAGDAGLQALRYGWLADLVVARAGDEAIVAYVVSDVQQDGTVVGYEGVVANMTTNAEKEITSVLLTSCETFYLRVSGAGVVRREATRAGPIPQLYLDRSRIKNVAFERVRFKTSP